MADTPDTLDLSEPSATAAELMQKIADQTTLDEFFKRHPKTLTRQDYINKIEAQRRERARFFVSDGDRKQKRRGK